MGGHPLVALVGHRMTVTHTDGFPVEHAETDAVLLGMGERYDVVVDLRSGVFSLVALAEGKDAIAPGLIRTSDAASAPPVEVRPVELDGELVTYERLDPTDEVRLGARTADRTVRLELTGGMMSYNLVDQWRALRPGDASSGPRRGRVRLSLVNRTMMWHPLHLHGHTGALSDSGIRKDTVNVLPHRALDLDFDADNPGLWMVHLPQHLSRRGRHDGPARIRDLDARDRARSDHGCRRTRANGRFTAYVQVRTRRRRHRVRTKA